jgi:hypothetical protein
MPVPGRPSAAKSEVSDPFAANLQYFPIGMRSAAARVSCWHAVQQGKFAAGNHRVLCEIEVVIDLLVESAAPEQSILNY